MVLVRPGQQLLLIRGPFDEAAPRGRRLEHRPVLDAGTEDAVLGRDVVPLAAVAVGGREFTKLRRQNGIAAGDMLVD